MAAPATAGWRLIIVCVREPGGSLAARAYPDEWTGEIYYFDALGSTVVMTDMQGNVTDRYAYDAWGNVVNHTGTTQQPYQYVGELGYYDHWQAPALADMLHLGVRFYEPEVGRFGQRDRLRCSAAPYAYVSAVPTLRVDPSGLWPPTELAFGDGRIGVDSSCHPCKDNKKIDGRIRNIVSLGGPTSSLPAAPEKGVSWASTDGQSIPDGVSFTRGSFVPARPTSRHTILKIRDGWDCVWSCSKTEVKLHCGPNARLTLAMLPVSPAVVRDAATVYFLISQPQWLLQGVQ